MPQARQLRRTLNLWQLALYGVGTIVGAGIYSVIGAAAGEAGTGLWLSFLIAGLSALLAALSYAELASMYPKAGAEFQYLRAAFPEWRLLGFLAGFLIALNAAATSATVALAFGGYLKTLLPALPIAVAALALLTLCTAVNIAGIREATWVSITLICIEVGGLVLIAAAGLATGDLSAERISVASAEPAGIFAASALLFFMFIGFEDVANLSEEARKPRRDIPRALLGALVATTILYVVVCFGVQAVVSPRELAGSDSPLTTAGEAVAPWVGSTLTVTALFATASTALITLISISRLLYGMARAGDFPGVLARLLPGRATPYVAALVLFGAACALLPLGSVKLTASVSALGLLTVFIGIHAAVIRLRLHKPAQRRAFRIAGSIGRVPVTAVIGIVLSLAFMTRFEPRAYAVYAGALVLALLVYGVTARQRHER